MVRTQIYLTVEEKQALQALSRQTGRSQSDLIREAIAPLLAPAPAPRVRGAGFEQARGMWKDRDDLPDLDVLRGRVKCQPDAA